MQPTIRGLAHHQWPTDEWPIASLGIRCVDLFLRMGIPLQAWEEDGLGDAVGGAVVLPSGRVVVFSELAHAVKHLGDRGPVIYADAGEAAVVGTSAILAEVIEALGLSRQDVTWVQTASDEIAGDRAAAARDYIEKRARASEGKG